ncbi:MAG TPA: hypothetical protein DEG06_04070 [Lachnospiraceae bacterium]|jgi:DNA-directed RNA polymerase subunit M/transcription elongation factor TFIIS|nr:hypothetical protein [Lachnospiraceae bacterium]HCA69182.1 hypothetical protein [Lachnospiraceae bacterium]HCM14132.1 hypothetical protein [Lachnospiraceae bacterium]HCR41403.1 hypothetical protein [Lachnospiraceae bacterium]
MEMLKKLISKKNQRSSSLKPGKDPYFMETEEEMKDEENPEENMPQSQTDAPEEEEEYEVVEREFLPAKRICPDCGGITLEGLDFCDKCGGEL